MRHTRKNEIREALKELAADRDTRVLVEEIGVSEGKLNALKARGHMKDDDDLDKVESWLIAHGYLSATGPTAPTATSPTTPDEPAATQLSLIPDDQSQFSREAAQAVMLADLRRAMDEHKWYLSEKAGYNVGKLAYTDFIQHHVVDFRAAHPIESYAIDALLTLAKTLLNPTYSRTDRAKLLDADLIKLRVIMQPLLDPDSQPRPAGC